MLVDGDKEHCFGEAKEPTQPAKIAFVPKNRKLSIPCLERDRELALVFFRRCQQLFFVLVVANLDKMPLK